MRILEDQQPRVRRIPDKMEQKLRGHGRTRRRVHLASDLGLGNRQREDVTQQWGKGLQSWRLGERRQHRVRQAVEAAPGRRSRDASTERQT